MTLPERVPIPDEMACNFPESLQESQLYFVDYVHKINHKGKRQLRIGILTHDIFYVSDPLGGIVQRISINSVLELHRAGDQLAVVLAPTEPADLILSVTNTADFLTDALKQVREHVCGEPAKFVRLEKPAFEKNELENYQMTHREISAEPSPAVDLPAPEEVPKCQVFEIFLAGRGLDKKDWGPLGKSDPYIEVSRAPVDRTEDAPREDGILGAAPDSWKIVYKTEVKLKTLDPDWEPFQITSPQLCTNNDFDSLVQFDCWDYDRASKPDFIGSCRCTVQQLISTSAEMTLPLFSERKKVKLDAKKKPYTDSGKLRIMVGSKLKSRASLIASSMAK